MRHAWYLVTKEHCGKAPLKKGARIKHPFHLTTNTCYLHVVAFPNNGLDWMMHKPEGLLIAPGFAAPDEKDVQFLLFVAKLRNL